MTWLKKCLIVAFLGLLTGLAQAQNQQKADSAILLLTESDANSDVRLKLLQIAATNSTKPQEKVNLSQQLIELAQKQGSATFQLDGLSELGAAYKLIGDYDQAIEYYFQSEKLADSIDYVLAQGDALSNVASVYALREAFVEAADFHRRAIKIYKSQGDTSRLALEFLNYANTLYRIDMLDYSLKYLDSSEYFNDTPVATPYINSSRAIVMAKIGASDPAQLLLLKALGEFSRNKDHYGFSDCLIQFGSILIDNNQVQTGISYTARGYHQARTHGLKKQIQDGARVLSYAYESVGNYPRALEYQTAYYAYRDSLINAESIQRIADQRTAYEVGQKQAEVDLLAAQKRTREIVVASLVVVLTVILVFAFIIFRLYQSKNRLNIELASQKAQLEELNHTKDKFFSIISHDLRSPVSAFMGISRMIKMMVKQKRTDDLLEMSGEIDQSVDRLSSLLDNLLNWATQQQGSFPNVPEKVDVKKILDNLAETFSNMATSKNIHLQSQVDNPIEVWVDRNSTATIFRNLVSNALKFTPEGGKVTATAILSENAEISISDSGIGMNQEKIDQILQSNAYHSTYGTGGEKGLGLGLQLVQEFIEMNHGSLKIDSVEGQGTTFVVSLPLFEKAEKAMTSK